MLITTLTPLSRSVVAETLAAAHRRHVREWGVETSLEPRSRDRLWDRQPLADLVIATWGVDPKTVGHLLRTQPTLTTPSGNSNRAAKTSLAWLQELPTSSQKLQAWSQRVFQMSWSQAQLLQVMEEIEPQLTTAFLNVERMAAMACGQGAVLQELLVKHAQGDSAYLAYAIVSGLPTPLADLVASFGTGDVQAWMASFGHRAGIEIELSQPRFRESMPYGLERPEGRGRWDQTRATSKQAAAQDQALGTAGFFQRAGMRRAIDQVQGALIAHAQTVDTLASVLAASRRWSLAAAAEAMRDGRLQAEDEIFLLELEEIKQIMTGEWHSRDQIAPILAEREGGKSIKSTLSGSLGVAGEEIRGHPCYVEAPEAECPAQQILCAPHITPAWAYRLRACNGIVSAEGDWLSPGAEMARAGDLAMVFAPLPPQGCLEVQLQPAQNAVLSRK